jgi:hypothetical protein
MSPRCKAHAPQLTLHTTRSRLQEPIEAGTIGLAITASEGFGSATANIATQMLTQVT